jgi:hypothetical protein
MHPTFFVSCKMGLDLSDSSLVRVRCKSSRVAPLENYGIWLIFLDESTFGFFLAKIRDGILARFL